MASFQPHQQIWRIRFVDFSSGNMGIHKASKNLHSQGSNVRRNVWEISSINDILGECGGGPGSF